MNYYKQVAEMLGVELNEEFSLKNKDDEILSNKYKITGFGGLLFKCGTEWCRSGYIDEIINGKLTIVKLPWKPKIYEQYWYCSTIAKPVVVATTWGGFSNDLCKWKCGNCFKTKKEAETKGKEIMEAIQKEFV